MTNIQATPCAWTDDGQPRSSQYDDVYYGDAGLEESRYVFLGGCDVTHRWSKQSVVPLVVGETGFGTGLNFLTLWQAWLKAGQPGTIHFISVEKHLMCVDDLARAHDAFPELAPLAQLLRASFPKSAGRHDLNFENGRMRLTVLAGEGADMLATLAPRRMVDCWFLDGFAPALNPDLWSDRLFREIARLSKDGASLATFTAVGDVRRRLAHVGFKMERRKGFGRKRHMSIGRFDGHDAKHSPHKLSWADSALPTVPPKKVTIVGAGLAGLLTARAIKAKAPEISVTVIERQRNWAATVSAIPAALITPWLDHGAGGGPRFMGNAFSFACDFWASIGASVWHDTGVELSDKGLHIAQTGWVDGAAALALLAKGGDVRFGVTRAPVSSANHAVILCPGVGLTGFLDGADLPLKPLAGQIALVNHVAHGFTMPQMADHYLIPDGADRLVIGASFRDPSAAVPNDDDRAGLLDSFNISGQQHVSDWSGSRLTVPDRLPLMGPVPDFDQWRTMFAPIKHGPTAVADMTGPLTPGLFVMGALGSRGFMTAPLLADNLAAMVCGQVPSLARDELAALHPGRFLIRELRRS